MPARSDRLRRRMNRRIVLVAAAGVVVAAAIAVPLLVGSGATGSTPGGDLAQMSNHGQPIDATPGQRKELETVGAVRAARVASRSGRTFYRLVRADGSICYAVDRTNDPDRIGNTSCPSVAGSFPSPGQPVLDLSVFESTSHVPGDTHLVAAQGFAADGVATVVLDSAGRVVTRTRADDNVYALDVPPGRVATTVVAYDRDREEVFRLP
jgi:hypothetical protein